MSVSYRGPRWSSFVHVSQHSCRFVAPTCAEGAQGCSEFGAFPVFEERGMCAARRMRRAAIAACCVFARGAAANPYQQLLRHRLEALRPGARAQIEFDVAHCGYEKARLRSAGTYVLGSELEIRGHSAGDFGLPRFGIKPIIGVRSPRYNNLVVSIDTARVTSIGNISRINADIGVDLYSNVRGRELIRMRRAEHEEKAAQNGERIKSPSVELALIDELEVLFTRAQPLVRREFHMGDARLVHLRTRAAGFSEHSEKARRVRLAYDRTQREFEQEERLFAQVCDPFAAVCAVGGGDEARRDFLLQLAEAVPREVPLSLVSLHATDAHSLAAAQEMALLERAAQRSERDLYAVRVGAVVSMDTRKTFILFKGDGTESLEGSGTVALHMPSVNAQVEVKVPYAERGKHSRDKVGVYGKSQWNPLEIAYKVFERREERAQEQEQEQYCEDSLARETRKMEGLEVQGKQLFAAQETALRTREALRLDLAKVERAAARGVVGGNRLARARCEYAVAQLRAACAKLHMLRFNLGVVRAFGLVPQVAP